MTDMTQAQDLPAPVLAPCPFCNGEAAVSRAGDRRQSTVYECTECGCRLECSDTFDHGSLPRNPAWNRRPYPKAEMQGGEMAKALKAARRIVKMAEKAEKDGLVINGRVVARHYSDIAAESCLAISRALLSAPKDASRDDVLEEAAKVADKYSNAGVEGFLTAGMIARDIRSLVGGRHDG